VNGRKGVQGVAAVAAEVGALGRRADEGVEVAVDDGGTNWMQAGRAVPSQCGEKRKSNAELVEHLAAGSGDIGRVVFEFTPGRHWIVLLDVVLFSLFVRFRSRNCGRQPNP